MPNRLKPIVPAAVLAALLAAAPVLAGPFGDAEAALRAAYAHYRVALFATNMGQPDKAAAELQAFSESWTALQPVLSAAPQYAEDAQLADTFAKVTALTEEAAAAVKTGTLAPAHEVLEGIRTEVAGLHDRAGILGFSDRMNTYHAAMEQALALTPDQLATPQGLETAAELAGVLGAAAADIASHPAPEATDAEYDPLAQAFQATVDAYVAAVRAGDAAAIVKAQAGLKPAYSKFFLRFG